LCFTEEFVYFLLSCAGKLLSSWTSNMFSNQFSIFFLIQFLAYVNVRSKRFINLGI
jgi:hypothetical protein